MNKPKRNTLTAGERRLAESRETPRGSQSKALERSKPAEFRYAREHADDTDKPGTKRTKPVAKSSPRRGSK